ncbi:sensor domain-containing protein [Halobacteria archaeon AArc-dxtr1]|nr:sensor domain-containing protein [Halobacteria archaeon AArc-dxtr1]
MSRPGATAASDRFGRLGAGLQQFVTVPFRRQTYLNLAYLLLAFPLGLVYFVGLTVGLSVGIALVLSVVLLLVGLPILAITIAVALSLAGFERWLTSAMLDVEIGPKTELAGDRTRDRVVSLVKDPKTWAPLLYLPAKFVLGVLSFVIVTTGLSTGVSMLLLPLYYDRPGLYVGLVSDRAPEFSQTLYLGWNYLLVGFEAVITLGHWRIETLPAALLAAVVGVGVVLTTLHLLNAVAGLFGRFARLTLADSYDPVAVLRRSS